MIFTGYLSLVKFSAVLSLPRTFFSKHVNSFRGSCRLKYVIPKITIMKMTTIKTKISNTAFHYFLNKKFKGV